MSHVMLYSLLPPLIGIGVALLLIVYLKNRLQTMRRTYTIRGKRGTKVRFTLGENEEFASGFRRALAELRLQEERNGESGKTAAPSI